MLTKEHIHHLEMKSKEMREDILKMCHGCGKNNSHLSGCLSAVETLAVLFLETIDLVKTRDRIILSKGHAGIALYAAMKQAGLLTQEEIERPLRGSGSELFRHPARNPGKYIETTAGSLGQGLSYGAGLALAMKKKFNNSAKVFVMVGDGECNEGSVWEAAAFASHMKLDNLIVIVDKNNLQLDGFTNDIMNMDNMAEKWSAFGFDIKCVDGHNVNELYTALLCAKTQREGKPFAIIANTTKGKGVSFAENVPEWHDAYMDDKSYAIALQEVKDA